MKDIHCHILPGVDDGAQTMDESLAMLAAAREIGVTSMICTPHCRSMRFNYQDTLHAFEDFQRAAKDFPVSLGFEVAHRMLQLIDLKYVHKLAFRETGEFLLELDVGASESMYFNEYAQTIFNLQGLDLKVIIAHPERYQAIQKNPSLAHELIRMGCSLQASADFMVGGRLGGAKRPAKYLIKEELYDYVASDAHFPKHYSYLAKVLKKYDF